MKFKINIFILGILLLTTGVSYAAEDICYTCHNSYLLEKNQSCTAWTEHSHPVYVTPSRTIQVPPDLPLNDRGQITCNTCHVVYGDTPKDSPDKNPQAFSRKIYLRNKNIDSSLCKMCHTMQASAQLRPETEEPQYNFVVDESYDTEEGIKQEGLKIKYNHPVDVSSMRLPRQLSISGEGNKSKKDRIICETCHRVHQAKGKPLLAINNERGMLCGSCHGAMYAQDRIDSARKGTHPVNIKPTIAVLSPDIIIRGGRKNSYGEIVCLTCHAVHAAATPQTLLVKENTQSSLCTECHKKEKQSLANTKHDIRKLYPDTQNILQQKPSQSGMCGVCHLAHKGTGPKMWARPFEKKEETISNLCKSCHETGKMAADQLIGNHTHPVGVSLDKLRNNTLRYSWLPLYSDEGIIEAKGVITCATCHNVHQWEPDYEIAPADALTVEGDVTNSFLRMKDTNSQLCTYCHKRQKLIEYTVHDPRTALYNQGGIVPSRVDINGRPVYSPNSGVCSTCHIPHNAHSRRLWAREIGPGTDPITRICSSCHDDGFIASEKQVGEITHPNNISFSKPFPIELPLYNEQLAKVEKGKILCSTCHDIHQWDPDILTSGAGTKEEGGPGDSFLRIAANSRRKSLCDGCHIDQQWIKNTDHDLTVTAPDKTDNSGRTPRQTGVCLPCHAVHNAPNQMALWRPALGPGKDKITAMCNSCHYTDKIAQAKMLTPNSHPVGISTFSILDSVQSTSLPIFDDDYKQIKKTREELAPIFFSEDLDSRTKVESIKMYFRVLRGNYLYARREIPVLRKNIEKLMEKIKLKQNMVAQQKTERKVIQKRIDDSIDQYKKLEFNITLLRTKKKLLEKTSPRNRTERESSDRSLKKLNNKIEKMENNYKKTEKYFNNLYREIKEIRKKYWKELDWIDSAEAKTDRMKRKYIQLIDKYKITKKELENIIVKVKGKKRSKKIDMSELDKLDLIFSGDSFEDNLTKGDLIQKLFDFRQKYFDMVKKVEGLKRKTKKILQTPSTRDFFAERKNTGADCTGKP
jgi:predicted CXXCH cytochrome family protein